MKILRKAVRDTIKKYYRACANKEKISEYTKENRGQDKINSVVSKLENMSMEELAKILIEARKTKLLAGTSSSLMAHRGKFRKKTFKKNKRQWTLKYFRDAVTDVVTAL